MLIIHHTLHNNRKKVLIVRHTPENRLKNKILSYTHKNNSKAVIFFASRDFCNFVATTHCVANPALPLTASEEKRKRKAFANIERTSEYKSKYTYGRT